MDLEIVAGGHDGMLVGCSIDLLQDPELQVLRKKYHEKGHDGIIRCVASGGRYLASGGTDETIQLYDMRRHVNVGSLLHHEASITALCFHKERHLLSASEDGTICVWSCGRKWELVYTLAGHKYAVTSLAVHPSGKLALSAGRDRTLRTWDLMDGRLAFTLRLRKAADLVGWSPVGDQFVIAVGSSVMVHSVESGECVTDIEVGQQINCLVFVQDSVLAVGCSCPDVLLFSTTTGDRLTTLSGHTNRVKGLAVSPDCRLLFSVSSDGTMRAWTLPQSLDDCKCVSTLELGTRLTCVSALLPERLSEGGGGGGEKGVSAAEDMDGVLSGKDMFKSGQEEEVSGQTTSEQEELGQKESGQNRKTMSGQGQRSKVRSRCAESGQNSKSKLGCQGTATKSQKRKSGQAESRQSTTIKTSGQHTLKSGQVVARKHSKAKSEKKDALKKLGQKSDSRSETRSEIVKAPEGSKDKDLPPGKAARLPKRGKKRKFEGNEEERTITKFHKLKNKSLKQ